MIHDELAIVSSTAGGSGNEAELVMVLTQYDTDGTSLRTWTFEHAIEDPISHEIKMPISFHTGLIPVDVGDYFTVNFAFNSSKASDNIRFYLPADNPGLEERFEFIYFPTTSITNAGLTPSQQNIINKALTDASLSGNTITFSRLSGGDSIAITIPSAETGATIKSKLEALSGANRLDSSAIQGIDEADFEITPKEPTDLSPFPNGKIIRTPDKWLEVQGADANERHSFRTSFVADPSNPQQSSWVVGTDLSFGVSYTTSRYGELYTADGGKPFTPENTLIRSLIIEREVTAVPVGGEGFVFSTNMTMTIPRSALTSAPNTLFVRFYTGQPASNNQVVTAEFRKAADNPSHDYHTYIDPAGSLYAIDQDDILSIQYFSLFTSSPSTGDQTSHALELHDAKKLVEFDPPAASWALRGMAAPTGAGANYEADEADTDKALKVAVEELTPAGPPGAPTAAPSDVTFLERGSPDNDFSFFPAGNRGSSSLSVPTDSISWINFNSNTYDPVNERLKYLVVLTNTLVKQKTPLNIEIDDTPYALTFAVISSGNTQYLTSTIPTQDRVSATDLTKKINFELVDNEQVTLVRQSFPEAWGNITPDIEAQMGLVGSGRRSRILYIGEKTPTHLLVNGRAFGLERVGGTASRVGSDGRSYQSWRTDGLYPDVNFRPSSSNLTLGLNVRFSDGTHANNTRTHLFQTSTAPTPEVKEQKTLTRAGVLDWIGFSTGELNTPRRVTALPATGLEGEDIILTTTGDRYRYLGSAWVKAEFDASKVNDDKDYTISVEEETPGTTQDKNLALTQSGNTFGISSPFPGINRLYFSNDSTDTDLYNRYLVTLPITNADVDPPTRLKIGTTNYSLSYEQTEAGQAVYRTPVVNPADRITTAKTINNVNIFTSVWLGHTGTIKTLKTADKNSLKAAVVAPLAVHAPPSAPQRGTRIRMLNNVTIRGGAVLSAAESAGHSIGYDASSAFGSLGKLVPTNSKIEGLASYTGQYSVTAFRNKTVFERGDSFVPTKVWINGTEYPVTSLQTNYYTLTGLDGSYFRNGYDYYINAQDSANNYIFPNVTLAKDKVYVFTGLFWQEDKVGLDQDEVDARIDAKVLNFAETGNTDYIPASKLIRNITQAQYDALAQKEDILYGITS